MLRTYQYDPAGSLTARSDFEGNLTTWSHDALGRVVLRQVPGEPPVTTTYTPDGLRATVTDGRGTTSYQYDARRRLTRVDHPDGTWIAYATDGTGSVTSVETPGGTTSYTYDPTGRLETVTDADAGVTTLAYDAVGNWTSQLLPNGTETLRGYDALHRLTALEHRAPDASVFASYQYTLDPAGNRLQLLQGDGRQITWAYDALHRLVREESTGGPLPARTLDHAYDAVGNRVLETVDGVPTAATYDANDRLLSQGSTTFTYDPDGNTTSRSDTMGTTLYAYDGENRLTGIDGPSGLSTYAYDADGSRVEATEAGATTRYLVDTNRPFAQVVEERDGAGSLRAHLTWGAHVLRRPI